MKMDPPVLTRSDPRRRMADGFLFQEGGLIPRRGFRAGEMEPGSRGRSDVVTEEVVPVFGGGTQSLDGGMKVAHALGHEVARGIGVKAAVDGLVFEKRT